jgi:hypothetical protein
VPALVRPFGVWLERKDVDLVNAKPDAPDRELPLAVKPLLNNLLGKQCHQSIASSAERRASRAAARRTVDALVRHLVTQQRREWLGTPPQQHL